MKIKKRFDKRNLRYIRNSKKGFKDSEKLFGLIIQAEVCVIIILVVFVISFSDTALTNRLSERLKNAISLTYSYDDIFSSGETAIKDVFKNEEIKESPKTKASPKKQTLPSSTEDGFLLPEEL